MGTSTSTSTHQDDLTYLTTAKKMNETARYNRQGKMLEEADDILCICHRLAEEGLFVYETDKKIDQEILNILKVHGYGTLKIPIILYNAEKEELIVGPNGKILRYKTIITWFDADK